jgi:hypothetical protein
MNSRRVALHSGGPHQNFEATTVCRAATTVLFEAATVITEVAESSSLDADSDCEELQDYS